jgi:transposase-like protein
MKNQNLIQWLSDKKMAAWFGRSFQVKADILVQVMTGNRSLSAIAKKHKISLAAVYKQRKKALEIIQLLVEAN